MNFPQRSFLYNKLRKLFVEAIRAFLYYLSLAPWAWSYVVMAAWGIAKTFSICPLSLNSLSFALFSGIGLEMSFLIHWSLKNRHFLRKVKFALQSCFALILCAVGVWGYQNDIFTVDFLISGGFTFLAIGFFLLFLIGRRHHIEVAWPLVMISIFHGLLWSFGIAGLCLLLLCICFSIASLQSPVYIGLGLFMGILLVTSLGFFLKRDYQHKYFFFTKIEQKIILNFIFPICLLVMALLVIASGLRWVCPIVATH